MRVALVSHPAMEEHRGPTGHPERPERAAAVVAGIRAAAPALVEIAAPPVSRADLERVHDPGYVASISSFCASGGGALDADTYAVPASWEAARRAAGAGWAGVEVLRGARADVAFCAVRPPGHHAERSRAMGFCLFNNIAIVAARLRREGERVAIVDWDVHHGNGTQHTFWRDDAVLYLSLHEHPFYPGSGTREETGEGPGAGYTVNVPLPPGSGGPAYRDAFVRLVVPVLTRFAPDWVLVSAGYDAERVDPLADQRLEADDYRMMAAAVAGTVPRRRLVFLLEGGYDLDGLRAAAAATIRGVCSDGTAPLPLAAPVPAVDAAIAVHRRRWGLP